MDQEDNDRRRNAHHPLPDPSLPPRATRKVAVNTSQPEGEEDALDRRLRKEFEELAESSGSDAGGGEYKPESNDEEDDAAELSIDEDSGIEDGKRTIKKKARRADLIALRAAKAGKRKDRSNSLTDATAHPAKKAKSTIVATGLVDDWQDQLTGERRGRSKSTSSHASSYAGGPPSSINDSEPADDVIGASSFAEDVDNVERKGLEEDDSVVLQWRKTSGTHVYTSAIAQPTKDNSASEASKKAVNVANDKEVSASNEKPAAAVTTQGRLAIAKVAPRAKLAVDAGKASQSAARGAVKTTATKAAETNTTTHGASQARKGTVSYKDVPPELKDQFVAVVVPAAKQVAGLQPAFSSISPSQAEELMKAAFPKLDYKAEEGDVFVRLINNRVNEWKSGFGSAALEGIEVIIRAMVKELKENDLDHDDEAISHQLTFLYGDPAKKYKERPFCWASWGDGTDRKGRFQSDIILWTFYWHLLQITPPRGSDIAREPPVGALVMSILATERALSYYHATGTKVMPTGTESYFSKDNWGDRYQFNSDTGKKVKRLSATQLHGYVDALKEADWLAIVKKSHEVRVELGIFLDNKRKRMLLAKAPEASDEDEEVQSEDSGMWSDSGQARNVATGESDKVAAVDVVN
ncbi:hypothetical protein EIP86_010699 [Pleurotus ostreatoroseus]|nr:hypothetical protein EIP86_010699 [Pleurotus ostreatoroseus]